MNSKTMHGADFTSSTYSNSSVKTQVQQVARLALIFSVHTREEDSGSSPDSCDSGSIMHELVWALCRASSLPTTSGGSSERRHSQTKDSSYCTAMTTSAGHAGALTLFGLRLMAALMSGEGESVPMGQSANPVPRQAGGVGGTVPSMSVAGTKEVDDESDVGSYGSCRDHFKNLLTEIALGTIFREAPLGLWKESQFFY